MKAKYLGKNNGFSTIELMIAFALISIVLVGAVSGNFIAQYWSATSRTANEGLYKAKTKLEDVRSDIKQDFYSAVSSPSTASMDADDPADESCIAGGMCYYVESNITDISSCSKYIEAKVKWKVGSYPDTTTNLFTYLTNSPEIISLGGDCILNTPSGDWENNSPQSVGLSSYATGKQFTSVDSLHKKIYVTTNTIPSFLIFNIPTAVGQNPVLDGSLDIKVGGVSVKANFVDVEEDLSTGRTYAFVALDSTTKQLAVIDVTDSSNPSLVTQVTLQNVDPLGSYPQGWRLFIYGGRLYMTTRETATNEFHIINISTPTLPSEIVSYAINRTVNQIIVREQKISGSVHRLAFLAESSGASPYSKQLRILDVTNDTISELATYNSGDIANGQSIAVIGKKLYLGRSNNISGPELYVFDISNPGVSLPLIGQGETGTDVNNIQVSGDYAYIGTTKTNEEIQVWNSDYTTWNSATQNVGRFKVYNLSHLSPLGFDINGNWIYAISNFAGGDKIQVLYTTP